MRTARETSKTQTLQNKGPFFPPLLPVVSQELVLKVPKRGQFQAAIRVTTNLAICVPKVRETDGNPQSLMFLHLILGGNF